MIPTIELNTFLQQASVYLLVATEGAEHQMTLMERILESNVLNVILVMLILGFLIKKFNLLSGIDANQARIASEIQAVENQKKEALAQLEDAKKRTANLKTEIDEIMNNAKESAEALSAQIITDAKSESAKLIENARRRVELEQRAAIKDLEKRLLSDALLDARAEIAGTLTAADQKRSVESFLEELSQLKGSRKS